MGKRVKTMKLSGMRWEGEREAGNKVYNSWSTSNGTDEMQYTTKL